MKKYWFKLPPRRPEDVPLRMIGVPSSWQGVLCWVILLIVGNLIAYIIENKFQFEHIILFWIFYFSVIVWPITIIKTDFDNS